METGGQNYKVNNGIEQITEKLNLDFNRKYVMQNDNTVDWGKKNPTNYLHSFCNNL